MGKIAVLDQQTIDKIAAGEVIERPSSVVKELVENAIDAGATAVAVEIRDGGISFLRVTDNGSGIEKEQVPTAFLRHATSKITRVEDLFEVSSLGFRGEALSSIAAIAMVELITKTRDADAGVRYCIEGGVEKKLEETAAPEGTTFLVRSLFYNTPARRKFLKTPMTEAGYISDLMERMALSHPEISFQFINNGQTKLHTSGNHNLKDVIYHIYGRDVAANVVEIDEAAGPARITGYIGKPVISRGNRGYETYFINGRYIKSSLIAKGIEDAYRTFMMQHKYPFTVLHIAMDGELLDVNVHPTKMELRFSNQEELYRLIQKTVREGLTRQELIPQVRLTEESKEKKTASVPEAKAEQPKKQAEDRPKLPEERPKQAEGRPKLPEERPKLPEDRSKLPEERPKQPEERPKPPQERNLEYFLSQMRHRVTKEFQEKEEQKTARTEAEQKLYSNEELEALAGTEVVRERGIYGAAEQPEKETANAEQPPSLQASRHKKDEKQEADLKAEPEQLELFDHKLLNPETKSEIQIIGQLFETYWLVQFEDKFYMIDQHAAHEKVLYERTVKSLENKEVTSQMVSPPLILTLTMQEAGRLDEYLDYFTEMGFEIAPFGGREYAVSAVPGNLFGIAEKELFLELLDGLDGIGGKDSRLVLEKIASMSCKGAVKGSQRLSAAEAKALIEELLHLENPYNCPHGRPTIISMTKQEIEKKFKRIV
ncbi:MAG: DNA mismatch repair endonuclease MutL [Lachnospiraceae bacterium]|nr:DNA mismatch repair endonuclease MutL [Lachnospiraceae bacterium]GFI08793.1 DNA mismatch repair protein MutL [Lachnospiraceae bacterium]